MASKRLERACIQRAPNAGDASVSDLKIVQPDVLSKVAAAKAGRLDGIYWTGGPWCDLVDELAEAIKARDDQIAALKKDAQIELVFKASRDKLLTVVTAERDAARRELQHLYCRSARDGECIWEHCPQLRDGEPFSTGRHCPLDAALGGGE